VQSSAGAFELAEIVEFGLHNLLRQPSELAKNLQL
jgi:hypothetical protein